MPVVFYLYLALIRIVIPMRYLIVILFLFVFVPAKRLKAQDNDLVELSGLVRDLRNEPIPYAYVVNMRNKAFTSTDTKGMFNMVVQRSDTVLFTCIGYKRLRIYIPGDLPEVFQSVDIHLTVDTVHIPTVYIYPWKTYKEFREAFMKLELIKPKDIQNMEFNLALIQMQIMAQDKDIALPSVAFRLTMDKINNQNINRGTYPSIPLLNPLNWIAFIKALKNGDIFRSEDDYSKKR